MAKRRVATDTDEERDHDASPTSKRARIDDADHGPVATQSRRARKGKGKAREDSDVSGEEDEEIQQQAETVDDDAFEERFGAELTERMEAKRNKPGYGGVAEYGIIESIEMYQFMCHRSLSFNFGPNINFIIGHNGSGKSAVLSAITVALGGKTNSTGRGSGLKAFIREGQQVAEVTISLKNQGEEAYKPSEYGKSILITRRFTSTGNSTWKIRAKDGRVISSKKEELAAICDHMNIQVDNPMNVLTQDAARQFLSASTPSDKYKFFLRGTQLSQLSTEYEQCLENITNTSKVLSHKREAIPDLRAAFKEATLKFEEASKAREQKRRVDDLKKELAWSHVAVKAAELGKKIEDAGKQERRLPKIQGNLDTAKAKLEAANTKVSQYEEELRNFGDQDELKEQHEALRTELQDVRRDIAECRSNIGTINNDIKGLNVQIEGFEREIAEEKKRLASDTQAKRDEYECKLQSAREAVDKLIEDRKKAAEVIRTLEAESEAIKITGEAKAQELRTLQSQIERCQDMINRCQRAQQDRFSAYGNNIPAVLQRIKTMRWQGDRPLGPLGLHVKCRDPQKWAPLLRNQLGRLLTAFAITDARDHLQLKKVLVDHRNDNTMIIIYEKDLFDYSSGEPAPDLLTVLRALEISDPYVERILINQRGIERMFLGATRKEGEVILARTRAGHAWTADGFDIRRFAEGGGATNPLPFGRRGESFDLLLTEGGASERPKYERELAQAQYAYQPLNNEVTTLKHQFAQKKREIEQANNKHRNLDQALRKAKQDQQNLEEEKQNETPLNIATIEACKAECEEEKAGLTQQFASIEQKRQEYEEKMRQLLKRSSDVKEQIDGFAAQKKIIVDKIAASAEERVKAQHDIRHYEAKLAEEQQKLDKENEAMKTLQEEFEEWTKSAEQYCERVETNREPEDIEKQIKSVQTALQEREKRQGYTVEEMTIEVNRTKQKLEDAKRELSQMISLNKLLKSSVTTRMQKWQEFRRHIALRCKIVFSYNLSQRGYFGSIKFNHQDETLTLHVQTEDQAVSKARDKEIHALSGGEKSFSTICLLLSLWESIGCPLRCLDEFDVFMDAVNRRISMKMMIDTANQSDKKQYVLITPQDMNNITIGPTVRVHRMTDPERNQGILAMS
ncbi:structural maintenance of chromosomes protein 6 [Moniliophthora roreri]|uniref:RecF/RecN/SMC N-terminal domain-containing protein n=1 Tax=Moniliophthora roreri TaxID=221103 RepID=A0A0W0G7J9_MONRR|nr:structural maintenance of chromosomes protein 6 [Moniliophthora roreri]